MIAAEGRPGRFLLAFAFAASGAAALIDQVAWQRLLALQTGVGIRSVATITAAFMLGLGLGSHRGGALSVRLAPPAALRAFAALELGVAAFAAASPWLYYDLLLRRAGWLYADPLRGGALHFLALLPPTALMGMTLPLLVRAMVRDAEGSPRVVADLYGINLVGAGLGALATPWLLIRHFGIDGALLVAAGANVVAATLGLLLRLPPEPAGRTGAAAAAPRGDGRPTPFPLWMGLYGLSGFTALSLEIVWFRIVEVGTKATAFTFGTVLAVYLLGLAGGSVAGGRLAPRLGRPLAAFVFLQGAVLLWAAVAVTLVATLPVEAPLYRWFYAYWGQRIGVSPAEGGWGELVRLYVLGPALLHLPPTFCMGVSFAVLQRAVQDDPVTSGRKVGMLQAANIAGCTAGSLVTGLWLLSRLGTTGTLRVLVLGGLAYVGVGVLRHGSSAAFAALALALVLAASALPGQEALWNRLHGRAAPDGLVDEDATGVVLLTPQADRSLWMWMGGKSQSRLPFGGTHTLLGALPALVHPRPRQVAIIGLGSGDTAWAAACRPETESVTVFELMAGQHRLLRRVADAATLPRLNAFLRDPRLRLVLADGRHRLLAERRRFDLIEADALLPDVALSGNVYSVEFFGLVAERLEPGGLACTWAPTPRIRATFAAVFPHVIAFDRQKILVGSREEIPWDPAAWRERAQGRAIGRYLSRTRRDEIAAELAAGAPLRGPAPRLAPNTDLYPRDEFAVP